MSSGMDEAMKEARKNSKPFKEVNPHIVPGPLNSLLKEITRDKFETAKQVGATSIPAPYITNQTRTWDDDVGNKSDAGKPPMSLIPKDFLDEVAKAFAYGRGKYGQFNFTKGMKVTRLIDAAMRHLVAASWESEKDPESGHDHLGHAGASIAMALFMIKQKPELDDRFIKQSKGNENV